MPQLTGDNTLASAQRGAAATAPAPDVERSRHATGRWAHPLWQRLASHPFDDARDARPLSARLMQSTGWNAAHTQRVLAEYRRFLYLAVRLQGRVCPSDAVDQAWHAHLLDSRRYFGNFCPRVLQFTLHHVPSRGGAAEAGRHASRYRTTLLAYQHVFGDAPPADIWPDPDARLAERTRHLSSRTHWAVPKPAGWLRRWRDRPDALAAGPARAAREDAVPAPDGRPGDPQRGRLSFAVRAGAVALSLPALLMLGCAQGRITIQPGTSGADFLKAYLLALIALTAFGLWRAALGRPATVGVVRTSGLVPVEHAHLAGGALRAVHTALASLLQRGAISVSEAQDAPSPPVLPDGGATPSLSAWRLHEPPPAAAHPLEHAVCDALRRGVPPEQLLDELQPVLDTLHEQLHARGLLTSPRRDQRLRDGVDSLHQGVWGLLLVWGLLRVVHGLQRGLPVALLIVLSVLGAWLLLAFRANLPHRRTREGRDLMRRATLALHRRSNLGLADPLMPLALALLGASVLGLEMQAFRAAIALHRSDGAGGCGGCGGSGGGGGDGGCSGCGGD